MGRDDIISFSSPARHSLFLLAAIRAQDVATVGEKPSAKQRDAALVAGETVRMPMTAFERYEPGPVDSGDGIVADGALVGVQLTVAFDTARLLFDGSESFTTENTLAVETDETLSVPRAPVKHYASFADRLAAFRAVLVVLAVAWDADDVISSWDEALSSDWFLADLANEAVGVPLFSLVFVLLHAGSEHVTTADAAGSEHLFVARSAVQTIVLEGERVVDQ